MADEQRSELETVSDQIKEQESAEQQGQQQKSDDDDIPAKYRGKSFKDIVGELETANKNMGRYSNELGEVRRLADELIKSQLNKPKDKEEVSNDVDIFENPQEYVRRAVETNPKVQAAEQYALQAQQEMARQKMLQMHPDALDLAQSAEFNTWATASAVRKELLQRAHNNFDVDAANELFSTYKELKAVRVNAVSDAEKEARKQAVSAAEVDSGGSGERSKKIFKRADLLKKMAFDKQWYQAHKDEIALAYAEGRVR